MSRTAYYWDPISLEHDTGHHAENILRAKHMAPDNLRRLVPDLDARPIQPHEDVVDYIGCVHDRDYHDWVKQTCEGGGGLLDLGDTPVSAASYKAALGSVNALLTAADAVMSGEADNAFSAMRPPGHHSLPSRAMGFCLFNNVAVLARYLESKYRIGRMAIVDFDVHHGNGTQHIFWRDPDVYFASIHQFPLFPMSGNAREMGDGPGMGATLNVPVEAGTSEEDYLAVFEKKIIRAVDDFGPEFLLVSAGFDGHIADPLADLRLTEEGFGRMTRALKELAKSNCKGRIISCLEGGYNLEALERSVAAHVKALME